MNFIRDRIPHRNEILAVFGAAIFVCYSWSLLGFFNKLSSFILYFTLAEIAEIFAFMMAFALLESLAVTGLLILLGVLLPFHWLRDNFSLKGFVIIMVAAITSILFQRTLGDDLPSVFILLASVVLPVGLIVFLFGVLRSRPRLQNIVLNVQDRILIMLFVYVPIGVVSLLVVLVNNLL